MNELKTKMERIALIQNQSVEITTMNLNQSQISFSIIWLNVWHTSRDFLCQESHKCRESNLFPFVSLLRK